jgi:hypothetical protein
VIEQVWRVSILGCGLVDGDGDPKQLFLRVAELVKNGVTTVPVSLETSIYFMPNSQTLFRFRAEELFPW